MNIPALLRRQIVSPRADKKCNERTAVVRLRAVRPAPCGDPKPLKRCLCHTMETDLVANGIAAMREQVLRRICNVLWQNHGRPHNLGTHLGNHVGQNAARGDKVNANAVIKDLVGKRLGKTAQGMLARNMAL